LPQIELVFGQEYKEVNKMILVVWFD